MKFALVRLSTDALALKELYDVRLELHIAGYGLSALATDRFGVRCIASAIDPATNGHVFIVNGCKASHNPRRQPHAWMVTSCPYLLEVLVPAANCAEYAGLALSRMSVNAHGCHACFLASSLCCKLQHIWLHVQSPKSMSDAA